MSTSCGVLCAYVSGSDRWCTPAPRREKTSKSRKPFSERHVLHTWRRPCYWQNAGTPRPSPLRRTIAGSGSGGGTGLSPIASMMHLGFIAASECPLENKVCCLNPSFLMTLLFVVLRCMLEASQQEPTQSFGPKPSRTVVFRLEPACFRALLLFYLLGPLPSGL